MQIIEDMKQRLIEARNELPEAQTAARREKANAKVEGRKPDKAVMDRPGELEAEISELPDDLYAAEIKHQQSLKAAAAKRIAENEPLKKAASDRMKAASEAIKAAQKEYDKAYKDWSGKDDAVANGSRQKAEAERQLEALYARGPEAA